MLAVSQKAVPAWKKKLRELHSVTVCRAARNSNSCTFIFRKTQRRSSSYQPRNLKHQSTKMFSGFTASLKSLGDKATGLFERKKKEAGDMAGEKATTAKKLAEDQMKKTQDAISGATSGAQGLIGGLTDDAKSGAKDVQKKADEKADSIEASIEDQIVTANNSATQAVDNINKARKEASEEAAVKIEKAQAESIAQADLAKAGANAAIDQGLKAAENAVDDQLRAAEKVIDEKMKAASKAADEKIAEANRFADEKRQQVTHAITENLEKVQGAAMGEATNMLSKLNLGGGK